MIKIDWLDMIVMVFINAAVTAVMYFGGLYILINYIYS